jgi:signal transduction histidine kinase
MTKQSAADLTAMTPPAGYTDDEIGQLANKFFEYDAALKKIVFRLQTYTSNVSHELRNPLFAISGATEILMLDTSQTDENRRTLGRIYQEARVMGEKIELLLSIAQGSESVAVHEQLDVAAILKNQINEHEPACLANEVKLSLSIKREPVVFGTEHALTIILRNVLCNAIRYSGKGKIEVLLNERGIVVEDSGRGVPEEMRNLVFERFFRGPSAQGTEGIGIGLSLVSEVCKAYGWKISVDGARSESGTRVTLELT